MKVVVTLFFLQYPGLGPTFLPPMQVAYVEGHVSHSPGLSIFTKEKEVPAGHT
jgi:hypothetical protein